MSYEARSREGRIPISAWAREGWLTITDGDVTDYGMVEAEIVEIGKAMQVQSINFDQAFAHELTQRLQDNHGMTLLRVPQTALELNTPTLDLERAIRSRKIKHDGNPLAAWMMTNAVKVTSRYNELSQPAKPKLGRDKNIDAVASLVFALKSVTKTESAVSGVAFFQ